MEISRRGALMGATAVVAVATVPTAVEASDATLEALHDAWWHARRASMDQSGPDEWVERALDMADAALDSFLAAPARTPRGVALKLRAQAEYMDADVLIEQITAAAIRDLDRLAGEA